MIDVTDVSARTAKISMSTLNGEFPVSVIPAKGVPGSAKVRVSLRLRAYDGIEPLAEAAEESVAGARCVAGRARG